MYGNDQSAHLVADRPTRRVDDFQDVTGSYYFLIKITLTTYQLTITNVFTTVSLSFPFRSLFLFNRYAAL